MRHGSHMCLSKLYFLDGGDSIGYIDTTSDGVDLGRSCGTFPHFLPQSTMLTYRTLSYRRLSCCSPCIFSCDCAMAIATYRTGCILVPMCGSGQPDHMSLHTHMIGPLSSGNTPARRPPRTGYIFTYSYTN